MATIICKRNKFNVVYSYYDEVGNMRMAKSKSLNRYTTRLILF